MSPHDASGPIHVIAGAQVMIAVPNVCRVETPRRDLSRYDPPIGTPLDHSGGSLHLTDATGHGVEMNVDELRGNVVAL